MRNIKNSKQAKLSFQSSGLKAQTSQKGVVLLEALIAILIFSIGILAIVGLQAAMIKNTSENKYRSDASFIAQERIGRMWADPGNIANYYGDISEADILPNGVSNVAAAPTGRGLVNVTVTWQAPGGDPHQYTTSTYIGAL